MSVDIGNLQRLSDDQVNSRLKAYSDLMGPLETHQAVE